MAKLWEIIEGDTNTVTERMRVTGGYLYRTTYRHVPGLGQSPLEGTAMHFVSGPVEPLHQAHDYAVAAEKQRHDDAARQAAQEAADRAKAHAEAVAKDAQARADAAAKEREDAEAAAKAAQAQLESDTPVAEPTSDETVVSPTAGEKPVQVPLMQNDQNTLPSPGTYPNAAGKESPVGGLAEPEKTAEGVTAHTDDAPSAEHPAPLPG